MTGLGFTAAGAAAAAFAGASARWNWWRRRAEGLPVLMYHKIGTPPAGTRLGKLWVNPAAFRWQMQYLLGHGFTPLRFSDLLAAETGGAALPDKPVVVTFDDGTADNHSLAFPILKELGIKVNIFLVAGAIGRRTAWEDPAVVPWAPVLDWKEILEMRDSELVEFGSHTMTHPDLVKLPAEQALWELRESKRRLEARLERPVVAFAYPYGSGAYSPQVRALAAEAGYRYDLGVKQGLSPWPWESKNGPLRRLLIRGDDWKWDFMLNLSRGKARL